MTIQKVVSDAVEVFSKNSSAPIVTFYSGIEGIKQIYLDTLTISPEEPIYAFLNPEAVNDDIYQWLTTYYAAERARLGITAHVFISGDKESKRALDYQQHSDDELRITHFIESYGKPFESEVNIYGDKVAMISYNPNAEIVGVVINHPALVATLKSFYLHYLWKL